MLSFFRNRQLITGRVTQVILTLTLLPILGVVLQTLFFGLSFGIPGYTLGIFICFLLMERDELLKDPLTLLNSRVQMENRLMYKIKSREPFTAIMIDVNGFKNINDTFGHAIGDEVLKDVSRILLSSANFEDFVCRFGGDEFFVILESQKDIGQSYIKRIDQILADYSAGKPYATGLSFGCRVRQPFRALRRGRAGEFDRPADVQGQGKPQAGVCKRYSVIIPPALRGKDPPIRLRYGSLRFAR